MQILDPNNVKIYNLSNGKSVPEWLSDRKRRALLKKNVDLRKRIELIQDFEMPAVSTSIRLSPDGHYIAATGVYKPRLRCYDVDNLAMKFERCFDAEVITFEILSEDYSKIVFLQDNRYVEFHSAEGRYYRLRMPKFGHDMKYHPHTCDLYLVGADNEIYRLNLEKGQYDTSFTSSESSEINKVAINLIHGLVLTGSKEGKVEAWDPRSGSCIGTLDCALASMVNGGCDNQIPAVTALTYDGSLNCGVGMSTGQVLLYDVRMNRPFKIKDHMYELPIKNVEFLGNHVLSMDSSILKIWNKETGNLFTSIDAGNTTLFNDLCVIPKTGMLFVANESVKIQTYYIPSLGPAPKWCGFLDALTEELEENSQETIYDDYKFVTEKQLDELGLTHLIGSDLLRAYMHGYFMDIRLYRKAKSAAEPFDFQQYKKNKIKEKIDEQRANRVQIQDDLPRVNKLLALKLREEKIKHGRKSKEAADLLRDDRFKSLFENPDFEVDSSTAEYKLLTPALKRLDERREDVKKLISQQFDELLLDESEVKSSSDSSSEDAGDDTSDEDSRVTQTVKKLKKTEITTKKIDALSTEMRKKVAPKRTKFYELEPGQENSLLNVDKTGYESIPLGERVRNESQISVDGLTLGSKSLTYTPSKNKLEMKRKMEMKKHEQERKKFIRPAPKHRKSKYR